MFVGLTTNQLQEGRECDITPVHCRSAKIYPVCRSPACAETQAAIDGENDLLYLRVLWREMTGGCLDPRDPNWAASRVPAALVTDSKNHRATVVVKGGEKRSDIEGKPRP